MTKKQIMAELDAIGISYNKGMTKAQLEQLLPLEPEVLDKGQLIKELREAYRNRQWNVVQSIREVLHND